MTTEQIKTAQQAMLNYIRTNRAAIAALIAEELKEGTWDMEILDTGINPLVDDETSVDEWDMLVNDMMPLLGVSATITLTIGGVSEVIEVQCE